MCICVTDDWVRYLQQQLNKRRYYSVTGATARRLTICRHTDTHGRMWPICSVVERNVLISLLCICLSACLSVCIAGAQRHETFARRTPVVLSVSLLFFLFLLLSASFRYMLVSFTVVV